MGIDLGLRIMKLALLVGGITVCPKVGCSLLPFWGQDPSICCFVTIFHAVKFTVTCSTLWVISSGGKNIYLERGRQYLNLKISDTLLLISKEFCMEDH